MLWRDDITDPSTISISFTLGLGDMYAHTMFAWAGMDTSAQNYRLSRRLAKLVGNSFYLSGLAAVITITTFLFGSPLWDVDSVGELTPVVTGSSPAVIDHLKLHHH